MKCLQELREFHVKKESVGFELSQLGELTELGQLGICNLETVASKKEANGAKLKDKRNLKGLELVWGAGQQITDGDVLEGLQPPPNLRRLGIINYGFAAGPSWLCSDISIKRLESLHLEDISWDTLPPFEQLPQLTDLILNNIAGMHVFGPGFGGLTERSFMQLKTVEIVNMPALVEWVGGPNGPLFSRLESIVCENCPLLSSFSFLACCTNLCQLRIAGCPELLSQLPPLPHTSTLTEFSVNKELFRGLACDGKRLSAHDYEGALAFQNMDRVEVIDIHGSPHLSLSVSDLQKMNSLRKLLAFDCTSIFSAEWFNPVVLEELAAHDRSLDEKNISVAAGLPEVAMSKSLHPGSFQLEEMNVDNIPAVLIAPICRRLAATLNTLWFYRDEVTETVTEEQEQALNPLTSLQSLHFISCKLRSLPRLHGLSSLREFSISYCDGIQSLPPKEDLPASLLVLDVSGCSREIKEQAEKLPCLSVEVMSVKGY